MKKNNRRNFLKTLVSAGAAAGLVSPDKTTSQQQQEETVKMLTSDGKLVEVKRSVIEKKAGVRKASDKEVFDWMDPKHKV